jgi:(S)-2-hydroxy-acid oxidase
MQRMAHSDGEIGTSRAAAKMGVAMCLSSYATTSLEEVVQHSSGNPYMMQMCIVKDRNITLQLLKRAESESSLLSRDVRAMVDLQSCGILRVIPFS